MVITGTTLRHIKLSTESTCFIPFQLPMHLSPKTRGPRVKRYGVVTMWVLVAKGQDDRCPAWGGGHCMKTKNKSGMTKQNRLFRVVFRDEILPSYVGVTMSHYKDPYETPSIMESERDFSWLMWPINRIVLRYIVRMSKEQGLVFVLKSGLVL